METWKAFGFQVLVKLWAFALTMAVITNRIGCRVSVILLWKVDIMKEKIRVLTLLFISFVMGAILLDMLT